MFVERFSYKASERQTEVEKLAKYSTQHREYLFAAISVMYPRFVE